MTHSPDAKSRVDTGKKSLSRAVAEAIAEHYDERTSFPALTDEEAAEERERLRLDRATIYAT